MSKLKIDITEAGMFALLEWLTASKMNAEMNDEEWPSGFKVVMQLQDNLSKHFSTAEITAIINNKDKLMPMVDKLMGN